MDNKTFIEQLSVRFDISISTVNSLVEIMSTEIAKTAVNLDSVVIPGFGCFDSKLREERISLHPASGKRLLIPPRIVLAFKQSPVLKQKINNGR